MRVGECEVVLLMLLEENSIMLRAATPRRLDVPEEGAFKVDEAERLDG